MEPIPQPVDPALLERELTPERFVKNTRTGGNQIFIVNAFNAPLLLEEIGRLRELTFREAGGGTGKSIDIDHFDTMDPPFEQLLVWNPSERNIVGGYRFIHGKNAPPGPDNNVPTPTAELFRFSEPFLARYWNHTIELGRSFVQPAYQPVNDPRKGLFALDNIWDGLGAIIILHPDVHYFFGKITMYLHFNPRARDMILYFLHRYFPDNEGLVTPVEEQSHNSSGTDVTSIFSGSTYEENFRILVQEVRKLGENIPPLVNIYMNLSATMKTFGTALNPEFGAVEETAILVTINDIYPAKKERHLSVQ